MQDYVKTHFASAAIAGSIAGVVGGVVWLINLVPYIGVLSPIIWIPILTEVTTAPGIYENTTTVLGCACSPIVWLAEIGAGILAVVLGKGKGATQIVQRSAIDGGIAGGVAGVIAGVVGWISVIIGVLLRPSMASQAGGVTGAVLGGLIGLVFGIIIAIVLGAVSGLVYSGIRRTQKAA